MNIPKHPACGARGFPLWGGTLAALALMGFVSIAPAQIVVETIGGGVRSECGSSSGFVAGNTWMNAQFHTPSSTALDSQGNLWVADTGNSAIEWLTQAGDRTSSITYQYSLAGNYHTFTNVIGVAIDGADNLYVLTTTHLYKYEDAPGSLPSLNNQLKLPLSMFSAETPTALTVANDANTNIYISFSSGSQGSILQIPQPYPFLPSNTIVSNFPFAPAGMAIRSDGLLAVSDTLSNAIYIVSTTNGATPERITGGNGTGLVNGGTNFAAFNQPRGIAASGDGRMVVCDTLNNCVRLIGADYNTTTLYGTPTNVWSKTCCSCNPALYGGWVDGAGGATGADASSRAPTSITIASNGTLFVTESYYNLIRSVTGSGLTPVASFTNGGSGNGSTNPPLVVTLLATNLSATGADLTANIDPNGSATTVYFTWGATTNMTNMTGAVTISADLETTNNVSISITNLQSGALIYEQAFAYNAGGSTNGAVRTFVVNTPAAVSNQLGFQASHIAGVGSTVYLPIELGLQSGVTVTALQFRVEVTPNSTNSAVSALTLLPITTNDFVPLNGPNPGNTPVRYNITPYTTISNGQGLAILASNGSGMNIQNYGVVGLLEFQIPYDATTNDSYSLSVLYPSGSGASIAPMNQTLTITDLPYLAGDSSPATGYQAAEFGDGLLNSDDVNKAILAAAGVRVPPLYSDAFNAMDVYPQSAGLFGANGDSVIDARDWNLIFLRSLGQATNWIRYWTNFDVGGGLVGEPIGDPYGLSTPEPLRVKAVETVHPPGLVWMRQGAVGADTVAEAAPGKTCSIPVYVNVGAGYSLSGLQFRAIVSPVGKAPEAGQVEFIPAPGVPLPLMSSPGMSSNDVVDAWEYGAFNPPLQNSNYLGAITFVVPPTAKKGEAYVVHFTAVDGAPDIDTTYALESFPGYAWVLGHPLQKPSITSDEWKMQFFGSLTNSRTADEVDADGDGVPNWQEFRAGTDPTDRLSVLKLAGSKVSVKGESGLGLGWLTAPGKTYILESIPALGGKSWTAINTNLGDGYTYQFIQNNSKANAKFYRILLQP